MVKGDLGALKNRATFFKILYALELACNQSLTSVSSHCFLQKLLRVNSTINISVNAFPFRCEHDRQDLLTLCWVLAGNRLFLITTWCALCLGDFKKDNFNDFTDLYYNSFQPVGL